MERLTATADSYDDLDLIASDISASDEEGAETANESLHLLLDEDDKWRPKPSPPPGDAFHRNYLVFYLLGMATLLPWNFFISVSGFWDYKFRDVSVNSTGGGGSANKTELQKEFASYLAIASNVPNAVFVILNAAIGQRFPLKLRIYTSLSAVIVLFLLMLVLSETNSDNWQHEFLDLVLILVVLVNCCTAVFQGAVFGVSGKFPPRYMGAVMAGQAMGGIFPAVVDICVIFLEVKEKDVGFACFLIATLVLLSSLLSFAWVRRTDHFKFYTMEVPVEEDTSPLPPQSVFAVVRSSLQYCLSVFLVFMTTLAVFPAVTVLVESSTATPWAGRYFTPVTCFLLFNMGDYAGRVLSTWLQRPRRSVFGRNATMLLSTVRISFVPIFMFCNAAPSIRGLPVYFDLDLVYVFFMATFAVSNGYLAGLCMLHGPKSFSTSRDQELSAMVLVAFLVLGASAGSFLSYPIVSLL